MNYKAEKEAMLAEMKQKMQEYQDANKESQAKDSEATQAFSLYCLEFNKRFQALKQKYNIK